MQYFVYDPNFKPEEAKPPAPEQWAQMGQFIAEATQAGVLVATGGLHPNCKRLEVSNGKVTVTDGPYIELKELLGGFAILRTNTPEEVIEWCTRFRKIIGDGVSEIVPIMGPE